MLAYHFIHSLFHSLSSNCSLSICYVLHLTPDPRGREMGKPHVLLSNDHFLEERHVHNYEGANGDGPTSQGPRKHEKSHSPGGSGAVTPRNLSACQWRGVTRRNKSCVLRSLPKLMLCINGASTPHHLCHFYAEHPNFPQGSSSREPLAMTPRCT